MRRTAGLYLPPEILPEIRNHPWADSRILVPDLSGPDIFAGVGCMDDFIDAGLVETLESVVPFEVFQM